jgi:hypothetical protein
MATSTIASCADVFPVGTSVGAYLSRYRRDGSPPSGSATDTATVASSGALTFDDLADDTTYVAYALVGSSHKYKAFQTTRPRTTGEEIVGPTSDGDAPVWSDTDSAWVATPVVKKGQVLYVEDYRATNVTDVATVQAALNALDTGGVLHFDPARTYTIHGNLSIPDLAYIKLYGHGATIVAGASGSPDTSYLIASERWIENTYAASGEPYVYMESFQIDAGTRAVGVVVMSRRFHMHRCEVYNGDTNVKLDAQTKNGTDLGNNMGECRFTECSFHEATNYNFWSNDPTTFRNTDAYFIDNLCFNAGTSNVLIDKFSGWHISGLHTYQYDGVGFDHGTAFTPGSNYDVDITDVGANGRFVNSSLESGSVRVRGIKRDTVSARQLVLSNLHFGLTAPVGAYVELRSNVSGGDNSTITVDNCEFYGPTTADGAYTTLFLVSGAGTFRCYINGGHFGYRLPVSWTGTCKVFFNGTSMYQSGQNVPTDLVLDGFAPTSNARPPGIVYRTATPSSGSEAFVVGDRWVHTAPASGTVPGGRCVTAGTPGTWVDDQPLSGVVPNAYRIVRSAYARLDAQAQGTLGIVENATLSLAGASGGKAAFYFDPAEFAISGYTTKLKLRLTVLTNDVAPTSTFTASLVPITSPSGAAATVAVTAGTIVAGSSAELVAPAATSTNVDDSGDFTAPAAGYYALQIVTSVANMAASSAAAVRVDLLARNT